MIKKSPLDWLTVVGFGLALAAHLVPVAQAEPSTPPVPSPASAPIVPPPPAPGELLSPSRETGDPTEHDAVDSSASLGERPDDVVGSPHDCLVIRKTTSHIDVTMPRILPLNDSFPTQADGETAVDADLRALNDIVTSTVAAATSLESGYQRSNFEAFASAVVEVSALSTERRSQKLTQPAPAEWVVKLTHALDTWSRSYSRLKNSCYM